jgi:indole-3-glycerol phosphate synthase
VKRRSPSAGSLRPDLDAARYARACVAGGAAAVSVLTDPDHFDGSLDDLRDVAGGVGVPVLRKDFLLDELQLLEARAAGASAVLLIVRALDRDRLVALAQAARALHLDTLIEVHTHDELETAVAAAPAAVGVNSRDLATFTVDLRAARHVLADVPAAMVAVAESGVESRDDVERLAEAGADAVLVGTALALHTDPVAAVRALTGVPRRGRAS